MNSSLLIERTLVFPTPASLVTERSGMPVNPKDMEKRIAEAVRVTRLDVAVAKSFIVASCYDDTEDMLRAFELDRESLLPKVMDLSIAMEPQIIQAVDAIRWRSAFVEAIWGLCHAGVLLRTTEHLQTLRVSIGHTDGRYPSGLDFRKYDAIVPLNVRVAATAADSSARELSDGDLYLAAIDIQEIEPEIAMSLQQAVRCFRHELYLPCLAMLARASEGAWVQLGLDLLRVAPEHSQLRGTRRETMQQTIEGSDASIVKKMRTIMDLYRIGGLFRDVQTDSRSSVADLESVYIWSDAVRDSRNAIHYGVEPAMHNSYEKVGVLLLATAQNLRTIYRIRRAAQQSEPNDASA